MADVADRVLSVLNKTGLGIVLLLEDIHWMDSASLRLLTHLVPMVSNEQLLIIGTLRTDFNDRSPIELPTAVTTISLGGFTAEELAVGLGARYPDANSADVEKAANRLIDVTGGNPLATMGMIVQLERSGATNLVRRLSDVRSISPLQPSGADPLDTAVEAVLSGLSDNDRKLLGTAAIIESLDVATVARYTDTDPQTVSEAIRRAHQAGIVDYSSNPPLFAHALLAAGLRDRIEHDQAIRLHAARCQELTAASDASLWHQALKHAQHSQGLISGGQITELADRAAHVALDELAYEDAIELFGIASEYAASDEPGSVRAQRMLDMATAHQRMGTMNEAYDLFRNAAKVAGQAGNAQLQAQAAIGFALPTDWRAGNLEALELVAKAEDASISPAASIQLSALQAVLEMRIPQRSELGSQWSWVLRPQIAQPRASEALQRAEQLGDPLTLLIANSAWRSTHRAPQYLEQRIARSRRALDLAVKLKQNDFLAEAAVRVTVDSIESGNPLLADEAVAMIRWAADRTQDRRVAWRALALESFLASLHGDWETHDRYREQALATGQIAQVPGALPVYLGQGAYRCLALKDLQMIRDSRQVMSLVGHHPLGAAAISYGFAILGDDESAKQHLENSLRLQDDEASLLQALAWCAQSATLLADDALSTQVLERIQPWRQRTAIDADATGSSGPLEPIVNALAATLDIEDGQQSASGDTYLALLTKRETLVLEAISRGLTNREIADELHFSLATVRRATMSIYNKLQVRGRSEAVKRAVQLNLLDS